MTKIIDRFVNLSFKRHLKFYEKKKKRFFDNDYLRKIFE